MDSEHFAVMLMSVFGALILGGLMAAGIAWQDKPTFLFALAGTVCAWSAAFPVMFDKPRIYGVLLAVCVVLIAGSVVAFIN
ncbi:hypothetical protein [Pararhizobium mangrovi]|uniref:Uncharacterized protein n=1 Tax=Pararhizobium mangrovi TaxID=2590452 RepID=A0A506U8M1_9HYPH|nr:hypothetical protein [Pararhizobium mangrovi]TPW29848.1 hypothetical protein FJU11_06850 [Pararhizobium mangrovi]